VADVPVVVNAPMAGIAGGALAAAVSAAGGLGFIGGGYGDAAWIDDQLDIAGDKSVGVGLITWALAGRPCVLDHVLDRGVRWIWLSFGDATPHLDVVHAAGAIAVCQVQSADEARRVANAGADVIVAQGHEAGGHGRDNELSPICCLR
jgi:nitronate monooxygenase